MKKIIIWLCVFFAFCLSFNLVHSEVLSKENPSFSLDVINVTNCMEIDQPGYYVLINDIWDAEEDYCFEVTSGHVVFDGNEHGIYGSWDDGNIFYIDCEPRNCTDVTIRNLKTQGYDAPIEALFTQGLKIENVAIESVGAYGIDLFYVSNFEIKNSNISYVTGFDSYAISMYNVDNGVIVNNRFNENWKAFVFYGANSDLSIYNNWIKSNADSDADFFAGPHENIRWNIQPISGKNIVGGPKIAGNYWASNWGVSLICEDLVFDGICDDLVQGLGSESQVDYYPLASYNPRIPRNGISR